jgi:hypothetical protein
LNELLGFNPAHDSANRFSYTPLTLNKPGLSHDLIVGQASAAIDWPVELDDAEVRLIWTSEYAAMRQHVPKIYERRINGGPGLSKNVVELFD